MESFRKMFPLKSDDSDMQSRDPVSMLKEDHAKVKKLFSDFQSSENEREKNKLLDEIINEIEVHTTVEEKLIYPLLRNELSEMVNESIEEHHVVDLVIQELKGRGKKTERMDAKLKVLKELVEHHMKEEEKKMLPRLKEKSGGKPELAEEIKDLKKRLMKPPARKKAAATGQKRGAKVTRLSGRAKGGKTAAGSRRKGSTAQSRRIAS